MSDFEHVTKKIIETVDDDAKGYLPRERDDRSY